MECRRKTHSTPCHIFSFFSQEKRFTLSCPDVIEYSIRHYGQSHQQPFKWFFPFYTCLLKVGFIFLQFCKVHFYLPQCHHMFSWTSWSALWRWRRVTDFSGWHAHEARLRRHDDVSGDIWRWNARGVLSLPTPKPTNYPYHGHHGDPPPQGKIPMVEPGIEPETSWLVARDSDR
jgi:hypothetical protein